MKKILILTYISVLGGVERSLVNMLKSLDSKQYNVDIIFLDSNGPIRPLLPKEFKVKELVKEPLLKEIYFTGAKKLIIKSLKEFKLLKIAKIIRKKLLNRNLYKDFYPLDEEYDIAICYHFQIFLLTKYMAEVVKAKKKYAFIHGQLSHSDKRVLKQKKYLDKYDVFFAVSEQVKLEFLSIVPEYRDKTIVRYNYINRNEIYKMSEERINWEDCNDTIRIVTVARLCKAKGYELAIQAAKNLKVKNINFKWHFIGDGDYKHYLLQLISHNDLNSFVFVEGGQINPYKYMKNADIYVQTSLHEGWCLTLQEARILNKPIVTTNFPTAYEQIKNGETGLIVEKTPQAIADAIIELINNEELRNKVINNLKLENQNVKIENVFEFPI